MKRFEKATRLVCIFLCTLAGVTPMVLDVAFQPSRSLTPTYFPLSVFCFGLVVFQLFGFFVLRNGERSK